MAMWTSADLWHACDIYWFLHVCLSGKWSLSQKHAIKNFIFNLVPNFYSLTISLYLVTFIVNCAVWLKKNCCRIASRIKYTAQVLLTSSVCLSVRSSVCPLVGMTFKYYKRLLNTIRHTIKHTNNTVTASSFLAFMGPNWHFIIIVNVKDKCT